MDHRKLCVVSFGGLKIGNHRYEFEIDDKFFEELDYSEIRQGKLNIEMLLDKQSQMLHLVFNIKGFVEVTCDRCLGLFSIPVEGSNVLYVKFGKVYSEESHELVVIPETQTHIDVMHYIYEFITLLVPYKHVHPGDENSASGCDPEVIRKLKELSSGHKPDARWDDLKKIQPTQ